METRPGIPEVDLRPNTSFFNSLRDCTTNPESSFTSPLAIFTSHNISGFTGFLK